LRQRFGERTRCAESLWRRCFFGAVDAHEGDVLDDGSHSGCAEDICEANAVPGCCASRARTPRRFAGDVAHGDQISATVARVAAIT
jgi:hypothetical protein